jgi:pimeloyl-ACP methyl ester carboxylesterase
MSMQAPAREQSRARYPDSEGYVERDGVRVFYEVYGEGERTLMLLPTWSIVHSRVWKAQIPYLARHARVVVFDGRGNGRSDRPEGVAPYLEDEFARATLAVMDATGSERATLVTSSCGALWGTIVAADHPERVDGLVYIGPAVALAPGHQIRGVHPFDEELDTDEGWAKYNSFFWSRDYRGFLEFFFSQCFNEPHSTKQVEDASRTASTGRSRSCSWTRPNRSPRRRRRSRRSAGGCAARCSSCRANATTASRTGGASRSRSSSGRSTSAWPAPATSRRPVTRCSRTG